jgi:hypothetical protein
MEAEHTALLYYCETHWLSRGAVLHRVCELNEERVLFVTDNNNNDDANLFHNGDFIKNIVYFVDICEKLSNLNKYTCKVLKLIL